MTTTASTKLTPEFMDSLGSKVAHGLLLSMTSDLHDMFSENGLFDYIIPEVKLNEEQEEQMMEYFVDNLHHFHFSSSYKGSQYSA